MTKDDMAKIFGVINLVAIGTAFISVDDFLIGQGFEKCEPTKESMLAHDGGIKGYSEFIETGNFEVIQ